MFKVDHIILHICIFWENMYVYGWHTTNCTHVSTGISMENTNVVNCPQQSLSKHIQRKYPCLQLTTTNCTKVYLAKILSFSAEYNKLSRSISRENTSVFKWLQQIVPNYIQWKYVCLQLTTTICTEANLGLIFMFTADCNNLYRSISRENTYVYS